MCNIVRIMRNNKFEFIFYGRVDSLTIIFRFWAEREMYWVYKDACFIFIFLLLFTRFRTEWMFKFLKLWVVSGRIKNIRCNDWRSIFEIFLTWKHRRKTADKFTEQRYLVKSILFCCDLKKNNRQYLKFSLNVYRGNTK